MNYIKHLTGFFEKTSQDHDLNPTHISLYMAIFQLWNQSRFQNPIRTTRNELMPISKISGNSTYQKCMNDLSDKGYINYTPSHNSFKGSAIEVFRLDFYTNDVPKKENKKLMKKPKNEEFFEQVSEQADEQVLYKNCTSDVHVPYINNTNIVNDINLDEQAQKNKDDIQKNIIENNAIPTQNETQKKLREKKGTTLEEKIGPNFSEVLSYFREMNFPDLEAEKFFNYFESIGWLVGGKTPMKDWKASARNWMIMGRKFEEKNTKLNSTNQLKPGNLETNSSKNYDEPF